MCKSSLSAQSAVTHRWFRIATFALVLIGAPMTAHSDDLKEPAVFASRGGVLDLLMIAKPKPITNIAFPPPGGRPIVNPTGWVYEICTRPLTSNQCPPGGDTVSDYGGVRLALQQGDTLKVRLINQLPLLDPLKAKHTADPGGANLFLNPTNLHTHGLIVPARAPTLSDPTFGDYVFVQIFNSANGTPVPQNTHQHGSVKMDFADYRIDIPANHPSGLFWFHPHVHGITLNQLTGGMSGIITIGNVQDYITGAPSTVRHLLLKDMQVLAAGTQQVDGGTVTVADGEVQYQESGDFCEQGNNNGPDGRPGFCLGTRADEFVDGNDYTGGRWYFSVNGQLFPKIRMTSPEGELWRITNASGQITYRLQLTEISNNTPMLMQLVAIDGVSINVPPGTPPGTVMTIGGNKFTVAQCPSGGTAPLPVCVRDVVMMPSSRAEVWVAYRDASGQVVAPPPGATANLQQGRMDLGPAGERWPMINLARVEFAQSPAARVKTAVQVAGNAKAALSPNGIFATPAVRKPSTAAPSNVSCRPLAAGHRRRIFFGVEDPNDPDTLFGLGYEEVDQNGVVVPGTQIPVTAFDPSHTTVCVPLGPGGAPVHETWELISLATEIHNFHMHQTKFRVLDGTELNLPPLAPDAAVILEDNVPVPYSTTSDPSIADNQGGYCTIAQWRDGTCTARKIVVDIPFSELGEFAYHCHIVEHGDGGMMAKIQVVPEPTAIASPHDFNRDGNSDIAWRDTGGNAAAWLMNGAAIVQSAAIGAVPTSWSVVGQRDFNGDGKHDWLWRDSSGNVAMWLMNGAVVSQSAIVGTVPTSWSIVGTGDFNGDGTGDILWRDTSGNVALWAMNGPSVSQSSGVGTVPTSWSIVGVGDFNSDGKSDILWRDTGGNIAMWLMNGAAVSQALPLGNISTAWSIQGANAN